MKTTTNTVHTALKVLLIAVAGCTVERIALDGRMSRMEAFTAAEVLVSRGQATKRETAEYTFYQMVG